MLNIPLNKKHSLLGMEVFTSFRRTNPGEKSARCCEGLAKSKKYRIVCYFIQMIFHDIALRHEGDRAQGKVDINFSHALS